MSTPAVLQKNIDGQAYLYLDGTDFKKENDGSIKLTKNDIIDKDNNNYSDEEIELYAHEVAIEALKKEFDPYAEKRKVVVPEEIQTKVMDRAKEIKQEVESDPKKLGDWKEHAEKVAVENPANGANQKIQPEQTPPEQTPPEQTPQQQQEPQADSPEQSGNWLANFMNAITALFNPEDTDKSNEIEALDTIWKNAPIGTDGKIAKQPIEGTQPPEDTNQAGDEKKAPEEERKTWQQNYNDAKLNLSKATTQSEKWEQLEIMHQSTLKMKDAFEKHPPGSPEQSAFANMQRDYWYTKKEVYDKPYKTESAPPAGNTAPKNDAVDKTTQTPPGKTKDTKTETDEEPTKETPSKIMTLKEKEDFIADQLAHPTKPKYVIETNDQTEKPTFELVSGKTYSNDVPGVVLIGDKAYFDGEDSTAHANYLAALEATKKWDMVNDPKSWNMDEKQFDALRLTADAKRDGSDGGYSMWRKGNGDEVGEDIVVKRTEELDKKGLLLYKPRSAGDETYIVSKDLNPTLYQELLGHKAAALKNFS